MATKVVTIRVPEEMFRQLPRASLKGHRTTYILDAIHQRMVADGKLHPDGTPVRQPKRVVITPADAELLA